MKKLFAILSFLIVMAIGIIFSCSQKENRPGEMVIQMLVQQVQSFEADCASLGVLLDQQAGEAAVQQTFLRARLGYKKIEWATEYFEPAPSRLVNGPPVPEVEEMGQALDPAGLQVIESFLFPHYDTANEAAIAKQIAIIRSKCSIYKSHFEKVEIFDWQILDAAKLEVFRIESLGMTGFDNPLTLKSAEETSASLESLQFVASQYSTGTNENISSEFKNARSYLDSHRDFDLFDRAAFILKYCNPLSIDIAGLEDRLHMMPLKYNRLLNQRAKTLFDSDAFNVNAYSPDLSSFITPQKIALGRKLFFDPVLSANGVRSCASCHQPGLAFTDGLAKNTIIGSAKTLTRNTPTLINAALQAGQFYDLRVNTLEDQSHDVMQSTVEMHGSIKLSVQLLWKDSLYKNLFTAAFPKANRQSIDTLEVMNAIGSYVRSLTSLNSRFDQYMRGNTAVMNEKELNGFNIFMGKAKCGTCHYMPLFNGSFPPRYMKTETEVIGVPSTPNENQVDTDLGRYSVVKSPSLLHAFKIATLRNIANTAPYMHNGVFTTLEQVIDFYDKGGGAGLGMHVPNQTLPSDKLNLTEKEKSELTAFLESISG